MALRERPRRTGRAPRRRGPQLVAVSSTWQPKDSKTRRRSLDGVCYFGIDPGVAEVPAVRDSQPRDVGFQAIAVIDASTGQARVIKRMGTRCGIQKERSVGNRARDRTDMGDLVAVADWHMWYDAPGRFQAEHAAEVRWHANGACTVGALMQWSEARCGRRARACRRGTGVVAMSPRVVCDTRQGATADAGPAELGGRGLAQDDGAGGSQARGDRRIGLGDVPPLR